MNWISYVRDGVIYLSQRTYILVSLHIHRKSEDLFTTKGSEIGVFAFSNINEQEMMKKKTHLRDEE